MQKNNEENDFIGANVEIKTFTYNGHKAYMVVAGIVGDQIWGSKQFDADLVLLDAPQADVKTAKYSLQDFAIAIVEGDIKQLNQLLQILAEDYGIYPCRAVKSLDNVKVISALPHCDYVWVRFTEEEKPYVPKVIGMVNPKPKGNVKLRRCLLY